LITFGLWHLVVGFFVLGVLVLLLARNGKPKWYLVFFSIFGLYILYVVSVIIFPFLIPEQPVQFFRPEINFLPFRWGNCWELPRACGMNLIGNFLLTVPFGFGINFIAPIKPKQVLWLALGVGILFEMIQLVLNLIFQTNWRSVDINDIILNAAGVLAGFALFRGFAWLFATIVVHTEANLHGPLGYVYEVVNANPDRN
jgi:glycopeptide antibiotics resistance protein